MKRISVQQLLITFVPSLAILAVLVVAKVIFHVSMSDMTSDVTTIANMHPLSGILSNLGILAWCTAASICAFAAMILRNNIPRDAFWFLVSSALLSAYLLFDDCFQIHLLASGYLGLNEKVFYATLGTAVSVYLMVFRRVIVRTNFGVLVLAIGFLASSVVIDAILVPYLRRYGDWLYFFEDGAKWLGIVSWCSYYVRTSHQFLVEAIDMPGNAIQSDARTLPR
jgi:hypothetical protein